MKTINTHKFLFSLIIIWTILTSVSIYFYKEYRIQKVLDSQVKLNQVKYDYIYKYYKLLAQNTNKYIAQSKETMSILKQLNGATPVEMDKIRIKLESHLKESYNNLKQLDFRQFHFHLKDNRSFLRMHSQSKFGDDLSDVRYGVKYANKMLKNMYGFEEGRVANGFRFIFPVIDEESNHLGSVEISVKAKGFIKMMNQNSLFGVHFLVKKSVVDSKLFSDKIAKYYRKSIESPLYYSERMGDNHSNKHHERVESSKELQDEISLNIQQDKPFATYYKRQIISFLPIKNIEGKKVAYFVIYTTSQDIENTILIYWILNIINILIFFSFIFILRKDYLYNVFTKNLNRELSLKVEREVEKNRKQELHNYTVLFNRMPNAAWVIEAKTAKIIDANRSAIERYGYSTEELQAMTIYDLDPRDNGEIESLAKKAMENGTDNFETIHLTKDGLEINVVINTSKILLNKKVFFLSIATDITKITKVQKEIQYHRDTLQTIVYILNELTINSNFNKGVTNSLYRVVQTLNVDRVYIFENYMDNNELMCSQRFEFVKENVSAEIDNPELQNILYSDAGIKRWKEKFLKDEHIEGLVKNFTGLEKEILESQNIQSILVIPIWYEEKFWGFIGFDDCTDERVWNDLESDVLKALSNSFIAALNREKYSTDLQKQVAYQIKDLREKDEQLLQQTKLAQMGDMVSMIAHQWRQPLNAISATGINLSLLSSMNMLEGEKVQESSEFIQDQCQKMSSTIDTFMNFVKPAKESKEFKISHAVESIMQIMGTQLSNHNIKVIINEEEKNISITGYEDLLEQVIINLLSNARDAFEELEVEDKFINITIESKNAIPIITIEDNAGGIPQDIKDKIFNPYFTTKEQGKGTGIGLYMSIDIMKKSFDGDLKYYATDGGSCFKIICGGQ